MKTINRFTSAVAVLAAVGVLTSGQTAAAYTGQKLAGRVKVTMVRARAIALKARPGSITDQELEKERGGSGMRYSFDIKSGGTTFEVGVDAKTGKVLQNSKEGSRPD